MGILIVIWLCTDDLGGFGYRQSVLTADYFNWHILMMAVAFLALMTPATASFELLPFARNRNKRIHAALQTFAVIAMIAGYVIIYDCHMVLTTHGLALSMHSIIGYMTISLVVITYAMGFVMYVLKWGGSLRGTLKPLHKRMGFVSWMLGMVALLMGITEKANGQEHIPTLVLTQVITGLVVFTSVFVSFSIVKFEDKSDVEEHKYTSLPNAAEDEVTTIQRM